MQLYLILIMVCVTTFASQKHLICKSVDDVFTEQSEGRGGSQVTRVRGFTAKQGPKGERGEQGPPGIPGINATMDYNRISEMIDTKIKLELEKSNFLLKELHKNYTILQSDFTELKANLTQQLISTTVTPSDDSDISRRRALCRAEGNLPYGKKCYSIPHISSSHDLSYNAAEAKCQSVGSLLAEIHSLSQQAELRRFVITKKSGSVAELWIGMSYLASSRTLLFRSGKEVSIDLLAWYPGYPSSSGKTMAYDTYGIESEQHGVWNGYTGNLHGVICEKDL